jgi:hypothetical protein
MRHAFGSPLKKLHAARRGGRPGIDSTRYLGNIGVAQHARDIKSVLLDGCDRLQPVADYLAALRANGVSTRVHIEHAICHRYALIIRDAEVLRRIAELGLALRCEWMVSLSYAEQCGTRVV